MQNNIDYHEIAQTVSQTVMTDISNKLNSMKPDFEQKIINALTGAIDSRLTNLENRLNNTQSRLTALEQKLSSISSNSTTSTSKYVQPAPPSNAELLNKIKRWKYKSLRGWIFYINEDDGNFLYMIRQDGTGNKQLTSYSVGLIMSLSVNGSSCTLEIAPAGSGGWKKITVEL